MFIFLINIIFLHIYCFQLFLIQTKDNQTIQNLINGDINFALNSSAISDEFKCLIAYQKARCISFSYSESQVLCDLIDCALKPFQNAIIYQMEINFLTTHSTFPIIQVNSSNLANLGSWYPFKYCPFDSFAIGFGIRYDDVNTKDKTGVNAIKLICDDQSSTRISSYNGLWGSWGLEYFCPFKFRLKGFQALIDIYTGPSIPNDDVTINGIKMYCESNTSNLTELIPSSNGELGYWSFKSMCQPNKFICGTSIQFQSNQSNKDDTALNNFKFACC